MAAYLSLTFADLLLFIIVWVIFVAAYVAWHGHALERHGATVLALELPNQEPRRRAIEELNPLIEEERTPFIEERTPFIEFIKWLITKAEAGISFETFEEAKQAFRSAHKGESSHASTQPSHNVISGSAGALPLEELIPARPLRILPVADREPLR